MKTATLPTLRVEAELRASAEKLLRPGESLSAFVEDAVQRNVERRRVDADFLARGIRHREEARRKGDYTTPSKTLAKLAAMKPRAPKKSAR